MPARTDAPPLDELLRNRRHARQAGDLRLLTRDEHWTREIAQLRHQQQMDRQASGLVAVGGAKGETAV